jgi:dihydrodipicolinate synthase/N-acetylneuraminate lyase
LQDYANGATATIHACEYCDLIQRVWDLLENGQEEEAFKLHSAVLPGLILEGIYGWQYAKIIMQKRGIFKNYFTRNQSNMISEQSMKHIEKTWERIEKLL